MIRVMDSVKQPMRCSEKCLDSQLWHACAGGMVQMPQISSKVFYFPQGHAEHANGNVDFGNVHVPPLILCRVSAIKYLADPDTDEVFAKIRLIPLTMQGHDLEDGFIASDGIESPDKPASFAKTLTQSDANNGGGFSVPRYCAETIFPRLDYSAEPPVQTILAKDVHGETWKFRHIYRGTPRRHLLTTGWSHFVNQKKLIAGDSIVFLRAENGDLCVGIRRAKRGIGVGPDFCPGWTAASGNCGPPFGGYSAFMSEDENNFLRESMNKDLKGRVRTEYVVEAAKLATSGQPFEVTYYPRGSTPEFFVKASSVKAAMQIQWCSGMRFKMAFETEDSSRISWFMGTISAVHVADPIRWPNSPWRLLQVAWDEPDLLQNVKRVSPWLVELVSNMPAIHLSPFSPPRKKIRLPQHQDLSLIGQLPMPPFSNNPLRPSSPLCCIADNFPGGIQGARHAQLGLSSSDLLFNRMQSGLHPFSFQQVDLTASNPRVARGNCIGNPVDDENVSCVLTMGNFDKNTKENSEVKNPPFVLFGQVILTEEQISQSCSGDTSGNCSSDGNMEKTTNCSDSRGSGFTRTGLIINSSNNGLPWYKGHPKPDHDSDIGHCKVFMESDDVGRTLDLSDFSSYEELYGKLANMFGIESLDILNNSLYQDASGITKRAGQEPFSEFLKTARRLTILRDSSSDDV